MAEDWIAQQKSIEQDLRNDGAVFVFSRALDPVFDPITSAYASAESVSFTAYGFFSTVKSQATNAISWFPETIIEAGDKTVMLSCAGYQAALEDVTVIDGVEWVVRGVTPVEPGGTPLLQYVLIRSA